MFRHLAHAVHPSRVALPHSVVATMILYSAPGTVFIRLPGVRRSFPSLLLMSHLLSGHPQEEKRKRSGVETVSVCPFVVNNFSFSLLTDHVHLSGLPVRGCPFVHLII